MNNRLLQLFSIVLVLMLALAACSQPATAPGDEEPTAAEEEGEAAEEEPAEEEPAEEEPAEEEPAEEEPAEEEPAEEEPAGDVPEMPGEGTTIRLAQATWDTGWFQTAIFATLFEELGYTIEGPETLDAPVFYLSAAQGDVDLWPNGWFPLHSTYLQEEDVQGQIEQVGFEVKAGALQGYLIDKATADEYGITNLEDLKDPEIAALFDGDGNGQADLIGCDPGWGCELVIEHHLDAYEMRDTVEHVQGSYSALMADTIGRYERGEPILFYTWTPNWTVAELAPGEDVVWIEVPFPSLPEEQADMEDQTVGEGIEGCVSDPCDMGFPPNDIRVVANSAFLDENPAVAQVSELVVIPLEDIAEQNLKMVEGEEDSEEDIQRHAEEWIEENRDQVDEWLMTAREAAAAGEVIEMREEATDGMDEMDEMDGTEEMDEMDGTEEMTETEEMDEMDEMDGTEEMDEMDGTEEMDEMDGTEEMTETEEMTGTEEEGTGGEGSMPGEGTTVRLAQATWDTGWFQTAIFATLFEELGYTIEGPETLDAPVFYLSAAQGDVDLWPNGWFPLHNTYLQEEDVQGQIEQVGFEVEAGALQGYLIDKATADEHGITNLEDLKDPEIAALFDGDGNGQADLIGCDPGWGCELVIEHHLDEYELRDTVEHVQGSYSALMADTIGRYERGEPVLFYTWTPNWTVAELAPGEDVVWIEVPFPSLPEEQADMEDQTVGEGIEGCVNDPCDLGFPPNDIRVVANSEFLAANPAIMTLAESVVIPLEDIADQNLKMVQDEEDSEEDIQRHAEEWIEENRDQVDEWLSAARQAAE